VIICGLDLETTGLNIQDDHMIELAWVIARMTSSGSLRVLSARSILVEPYGMPPEAITPEITAINGIERDDVMAFGRPETFLEAFAKDLEFHGVEYLCAHNGENFDKPFLARYVPGVLKFPWIDTKADIVYPDRKSTSLFYAGADTGFLNPFPHVALGDVLSMLKVLEHYGVEKAVARSKEPWVTVRACVTYDERELAKARRYMWEDCGDGKKWPKCWVKRMKQAEYAKETAEAGFALTVLG
jgi:DNA polymerase-3 subunit epsilon